MRYVLCGALKGRTIKLGNYQFVDGTIEIVASDQDQVAIGRFLATNWQAYPERLADKRQKEIEDGQRDILENGQQQVQGEVQPDGTGTETGSTPQDGSGSDQTENGDSGTETGGDGQATELNEKLLKAVQKLDPLNDDHWTQDGKPAIQAVAKFYGATDVTRRDVEAVAPGFIRVVPEPTAEETNQQ